VDWLCCAVTTLLVFIGYFYTLAPDVTLEDSGELAVGSFYAGVPHPPGYPVWTIYTWLFTLLVPISNIAWRVALSSAVAGALSCGLIGLMVSRSSSMILEGIEELKNIERRSEDAICMVAGVVAGMLMGFNGFMWSQAVIVEVYTFSVLSLVGMMALLLRWIHAPQQRKYLGWALFLFGICFTNHQTLIVAAMGMELMIVARDPKLGRDLLLGNSAVYIVGLMLKANGVISSFDNNGPLFAIFNVVGLSSLAGAVWLTMQTKSMLTEWKWTLLLGLFFALGAAFYLYMPLASMTNPPLNWGYPRTVEGFIHAFTRGQYERANPVNILQDPMRFIGQIWRYIEGTKEEFSFAFLLVGLVPFFFYRRMQKREKAWIVGLSGIFFCLAIVLLILLNPAPDRQSQSLNRVFFTASHVVTAMGIGYGLTLIAGMLSARYEDYRRWTLIGGAVAAAVALYDFAKLESQWPVAKFAAAFGLALPLAVIGLVTVFRTRLPLAALLAIFATMPAYSIATHWWENEQRGHYFGYWFGHDMFTPPFKSADNKPLYPEMEHNAVLYGGTDPGRFNPTYMIFCESFIPPEKKPMDPKFDRRDVYLITQNALADNTYLNYIRAHYNRSAQQDPPFFSEAVRLLTGDVKTGKTNLLAKMMYPVDRFFTGLGDKIEKDRREKGVYPTKEILTATLEDSNKCFQEYINDAQRRLQLNQLKPGEDVHIVNDRIQVTGQVAVMSINALLTKVIFDKNPTNEFYVEESFPLDWMYPHLTPYGIIMKINRNPLAELPADMLSRDHDFWTQYSERLIGNWITYDTPIKDICDFAERVYLHRNFAGYKGSRAFIRDDNAQKAFSKLRSAQAGLYKWRMTNARTAPEQQRMLKEADFAFKQALAFCPYSPEAVYRYIEILTSYQRRFAESLLIAETCLKFDQDNVAIQQMVAQLRQMVQQETAINQTQQRTDQLEKQFRVEGTTNGTVGLSLAAAYLQMQQTNQAFAVLDQLVTNPATDVNTMLQMADLFSKLQQPLRLEKALDSLLRLMPNEAEAWYDHAAIKALLNKTNDAVRSLTQALKLSNQRLAAAPAAKNLKLDAVADPRFNSLRQLPEFQALTTGK
jgi:tetratricopeptide (TPR) repeat protein